MTTIDEVWPRLEPASREWLIENNGDSVPAEILVELSALRGSATDDEWFVEEGEDGITLSDAAVDWVEQVANDE
jgi:hypothetical protein